MATSPRPEHHLGVTPLPTGPEGSATPPAAPPVPGEPYVGFEGPLPGVDPALADLEPQVTTVDWPPAQQQLPDDPADTPGWNDEVLDATETAMGIPNAGDG